MINHGVQPVRKSKKDYSTRSFGAATASYIPFDLDAGFGFPDQKLENEPNGCTWYTQNELCQDEDKIAYDRHLIRDETLLINGQTDGPCGMEDSLIATVLVKNRGQYFQLEKNPGMDWFDSAISVMQDTKRSLSIASPWFDSFESPIQGVMPDSFPDIWPTNVVGHNHKVYGLSTINGELLLIGKSWQGTWFGDGGKHYWTRTAFNKLMSIPNCAAFTIAQWDGSIQTIQYGVLYRCKVAVKLMFRRLQGLSAAQKQPSTPALPVNQPTMPISSKFAPMVVRWSKAIGQWEGADPASNNPGNLKYSTLTASWGATRGRAATDGGSLCHFPTLEQGQNALCSFLTLGCENELLAFHQARTLIEFTMVYAGGPPRGYINGIATMLGVPLNINISSFLTMQ